MPGFRFAGLALLLLSLGASAQDTPVPAQTEKEMILSVGIKMGDLNRVFLSIKDELDKQAPDSKGKKAWDQFSSDLRAEMTKVASEINGLKFQPKASLEAFAKLERELQIWQALEEERRGKTARANPPTSPLLGGVLPNGPTVTLVQYDAMQMEAMKLLQDPAKLKALAALWNKELGVPAPKAGENYGLTIQKWMIEDLRKRGLNEPPKKK